MAQFYDQDNPQASYNRPVDERKECFNLGCQQAEKLVTRSTSSTKISQEAKIIRAQQRRAERQRRMAALAIACAITGGVVVSAVTAWVDMVETNAAIYDQTSSFAQTVIYPNTHRTMNGEYYYYDYDDIADAIVADGKDFSSELFKTYSCLGEEQTNRVLEYTDYGSVKEYVKQAGFDSISDWKNSERKKLVIQNSIDEKRAELEEMHRELNGTDINKTANSGYVGGK